MAKLRQRGTGQRDNQLSLKREDTEIVVKDNEIAWSSTPNQFSLVFPDELYEQTYRLEQIRDLRSLRVALVVLFCVYIGAGIFNSTGLVPASRNTTLLVLVFGAIEPILIGFFAFTYTKLYRKHTQLTTVLFSFAIGFLNVTISMMGDGPDHGPHMLFYFVIFMFLKLRCLVALVECLFLFVCFFVGLAVDELHWVDVTQERLALGAIYMFLTILALFFAAYFIELTQRKEFASTRIARKESKITSRILKNLLPAGILQRVKDRTPGYELEQVIADDIKEVTILFSDIVSFTRYCSQITPAEVVAFLNELYSQFDALCETIGVYKVETIGDAYFVSSGAPTPDPNHASNLANMAFEMIEKCKHLTLKGSTQSPRMRIGLHTGQVTAGVVGIKMPRYHLFGVTVTIAEMMEQTGEPERVQVSETTAPLLKDLYDLEPRGINEKVEKKMHQRMETFFLKKKTGYTLDMWKQGQTPPDTTGDSSERRGST